MSLVAPSAEELETFIAENAVDEKAAEMLRKEAPGVQRMVIERGDLQRTSNPSSAVIGRIKQYKSEGYGSMPCTDQGVDMSTEVEAFIITNGLDERAAKALREEPSAVQTVVIQRGGCAECSNPSATVLGRIRDANHAGIGKGGKGKGGWDPWSMMAAAAKGAWDWGPYARSAAAAYGKGGGKGKGALAEVEMFIAEMGLDEASAKSLRQTTPMVQAAVIARGSVKTCKNPSSAIIGRIAEALKGGGGGGGYAPSEPSVKRARKGGDPLEELLSSVQAVAAVQSDDPVEAFIAVNRIDARAAAMLRNEAPDFQQQIMDRGSLAECSNPSAVLIARMRETKKGGGKGGGAPKWV